MFYGVYLCIKTRTKDLSIMSNEYTATPLSVSVLSINHGISRCMLVDNGVAIDSLLCEMLGHKFISDY